MAFSNKFTSKVIVANGFINEEGYNGEIADYRSGINYERRHSRKITPEEFWAVRLPQLKTRSEDVRFIIDEI